MYRVVLDTNVYVSAYGFGGKPLLLLDAAIRRRFVLLTSVPIMTELAGNLYRVAGFDDEHVERALRQIARVAEIVEPVSRLDIVSDTADNRVLEAAVDGSAEIIATGDRHLLEHDGHFGIRILRPAEALTALET